MVKWTALVFLSVIFCGCAVIPKKTPEIASGANPVATDAVRSARIRRIVVLELPATVTEASLQRVYDVHPWVLKTGHPPEAAVESVALWQRQALRALMESVVTSALKETCIPQRWQGLPQKIQLHTVLMDGPEMHIGQAVAAGALAQLQAVNPADAYVRWQVTDFGETPKRWRAAYIGFEVLSTAGIAGALLLHKTTRALAWLYLLDESAEEVTEAYAGFWALNVWSRPVRLQADWIDGRTGMVQRSVAATGLAPWTWKMLAWNALRDSNRQQRDTLLQQSSRRALRPVCALLSP